jgi:hypothetical protein
LIAAANELFALEWRRRQGLKPTSFCGPCGTLRLRSEFVTFLIIHDFLGRKPFVFSIDFCAKTKKSQPLRAGFKVVP